MEIKYLEDLIVFSKTLNYSAAAKELFITQSALSQRIAKMERELGFDLVTHGKNPPAHHCRKYFLRKVIVYSRGVQKARASLRRDRGGGCGPIEGS